MEATGKRVRKDTVAVYTVENADGYPATQLRGPALTSIPSVLGPFDAANADRNMAHNAAAPVPVPGSNGTRHILIGGLGVFRGALRAAHIVAGSRRMRAADVAAGSKGTRDPGASSAPAATKSR